MGFLIHFARMSEMMICRPTQKRQSGIGEQVFQADSLRVSKKVKKTMKTEKEQAERAKELQKLRSDLLKRIIQNEKQRRNPQPGDKQKEL